MQSRKKVIRNTLSTSQVYPGWHQIALNEEYILRIPFLLHNVTDFCQYCIGMRDGRNNLYTGSIKSMSLEPYVLRAEPKPFAFPFLQRAKNFLEALL